ncbi:hypothetical protein KQI36_16055 [Clostridium senegalense]|uniref:hypothetical protein n=1 Tax=Clostridium senegalense TaxID=1465809 RepID=UPI001C10CF95|nr:hypothetical protein [Clostridium senegalense]MBU5228146.1 hypothetical protein [Clostridium senegalense]
MSENRERKHYMLSPKAINYIEETKNKNHLKYNSEAIELIIREHERNCEITTDYLIKIISDKVSEKIKSDIIGIKQGVNSNDKNSQVLIELVNAIFFKQKYGKIVTTSEDVSEGLKMAIDEVEKRIITKRNIKLDNKF